MDIETLDVVLGAKIAPLMASLDAADARLREFEGVAKQASATVTAAMARADAAGATMAGGLGTRMKAAEPHLRNVGRALSTYVTLPTIAVGAAAIKMGLDFQRQGLMLHTQAGASVGEMNRMKKAALDLALPQGPTQLIEGLYHLESLGLRGSAAVNALKTSSVAAFMGMAPLEETASALGAALVTGIHGTENMSRAMGLLNATVGAGNMRFEDLLGALGTGLLSSAKMAGAGLPEVGAALAVLTDRGMGAEQAATRLGMTFALLMHHSGTAKKGLADLGIGTDDLLKTLLAGHGETGLLNVLNLLHDRMQSVGRVRAASDIMSIFGGGRTGKGALAVLDSLTSHVSSYQGKLHQINATANKVSADMAMTQQSDAYKIGVAWDQIESDLIRLGGELAPVAAQIAGDVNGMVTAFDHLPGPIKQFAGVLVGTLAVGGPAMVGLASVSRLLTSVQRLFGRVGPAARIAETGVVGAAGAETSALRTTNMAALTLRGTLLSIAAIGAITVGIDIIRHFVSSKGTGIGSKPVPSSLGMAPPGDKTAATHGEVTFKDGQYYWHRGGRYFPITTKRAGELGAAIYGPTGGLPGGGKLVDMPGGSALQKLIGSSPAGKAFAAAAAAYNRAHSTATSTAPGLIKKFSLPFYLQKEAALAATTKSQADDQKAARDTVTYINGLIAKGRLSHKAYLDALGAEASADSQLWGEQAKRAKAAKKKAENFTLPLSLQVAQARADALAALNQGSSTTPLQIRVAREAKSKAMKAIESHTLTLTALVDAWHIVENANQTLSSMMGIANTYHRVSTAAVTKGLGLSHDVDMTLRERLAEAEAHRGYTPNGPGVLGTGVNIYGPVHLHGVHDKDKLAEELRKKNRVRNPHARGSRR